MTAEDIEKAAYDWMERSQAGGHMHADRVEGAKVVESFIAPCDIPFETAEGTVTVAKGSWVLAMRWPPEIWESIQKGRLTGYSVGGTGVRLALEDVDKAGKWAPGPNARWRRADGDPARDGAAAEGGGTPADQGAAAARRDAAGNRKSSAKDTYAREMLRSFDMVDDIEERLQDMQAPGDGFKPTWEHAGTAGEVDARLGSVLGSERG